MGMGRTWRCEFYTCLPANMHLIGMPGRIPPARDPESHRSLSRFRALPIWTLAEAGLPPGRAVVGQELLQGPPAGEKSADSIPCPTPCFKTQPLPILGFSFVCPLSSPQRPPAALHTGWSQNPQALLSWGSQVTRGWGCIEDTARGWGWGWEPVLAARAGEGQQAAVPAQNPQPSPSPSVGGAGAGPGSFSPLWVGFLCGSNLGLSLELWEVARSRLAWGQVPPPHPLPPPARALQVFWVAGGAHRDSLQRVSSPA